ncbi:MAG: PGPGW domain-containing protein [Acidobacteriota bacterium]|nr:PGPGW domain-containing protein [Acidobacteriota bacterium]
MTTPNAKGDDTPRPSLPAPPEVLPPLPTPLRIVLYFAGWLLLLVGILGLVLPGLQGILTLFIGAAVLSLASEAAHRWLRRLLRPWPPAEKRFVQMRAKMRARLARFGKRGPR